MARSAWLIVPSETQRLMNFSTWHLAERQSNFSYYCTTTDLTQSAAKTAQPTGVELEVAIIVPNDSASTKAMAVTTLCGLIAVIRQALPMLARTSRATARWCPEASEQTTPS